MTKSVIQQILHRRDQILTINSLSMITCGALLTFLPLMLVTGCILFRGIAGSTDLLANQTVGEFILWWVSKSFICAAPFAGIAFLSEIGLTIRNLKRTGYYTYREVDPGRALLILAHDLRGLSWLPPQSIPGPDLIILGLRRLRMRLRLTRISAHQSAEMLNRFLKNTAPEDLIESEGGDHDSVAALAHLMLLGVLDAREDCEKIWLAGNVRDRLEIRSRPSQSQSSRDG